MPALFFYRHGGKIASLLCGVHDVSRGRTNDRWAADLLKIHGKPFAERNAFRSRSGRIIVTGEIESTPTAPRDSVKTDAQVIPAQYDLPCSENYSGRGTLGAGRNGRREEEVGNWLFQSSAAAEWSDSDSRMLLANLAFRR